MELVVDWFPNDVSRERASTMFVEFNVNGHPEPGGPTFSEIAWTRGVTEAMSLLPSYAAPATRRSARRLLRPWPEGRYADAYRRTGGILNLFTPPWGEREDEVWAEMLAGWVETPFPDEDARHEALAALEQRWNHSPHPFFAGLTPAQVMAGGGWGESTLAREFLQHLTKELGEQSFETDGETLIQTLMILRAWSSEPGEDGRTPRDIVVDERTELLARRQRALTGQGAG
jgi:hypothetical protein